MKAIFPTVYSTLCSTALSSLITEKYGLENVQCHFLVRGVGDTYRVETSEFRFILRVYRSSHRSLSQIEEEVALLLALKEAQVSVSHTIRDVSGQAILKINAPEGERHAVLFSYTPGQSSGKLNKKQLRALGNEVARFHNVSSSIQLGNTRWNFDLETTLFQPLKKLEFVFSENQEDYFWLQKKIDELKDKFSQIDTSSFSKGYCHFDFLPKNFHFENDSVTLFDFDFMGYGWLVNDIMTFWQHLALHVFVGKMTSEEVQEAYNNFLEGYREHRFISDQELAVVPYLTFGFWLFYMNFHTTHDQFYAFSQTPQLKAFIGILKNVAEKYWDKEDKL